MTETREPLSRAQQFLLVAAAVDIVIGWTYAAQDTPARARLLNFIPIPLAWLGIVLIALGTFALIATFRHRGLREQYGWAAASSGPFLLSAMWSIAAIIRTPLIETVHVLLTLAAFAATGLAAVFWARYHTGRLVALIGAGMTVAAFITMHSAVAAWSAWSSALVYIGFWSLIYLGALSTTPTGWGRDD